MQKILEFIEANIPVFYKAKKKNHSCAHVIKFWDQASCALHGYNFDTSFDILHHCGCCATNTKEPSNNGFKVRFP